MPIFKSAYQTRAMAGYVMKRIVEDVEKAYVSGWLSHAPEQTFYSIGTTVGPVAETPAFAHPLVFNTHEHGQEKIVIDDRPFGRYDLKTMRFTITNQIDYKVLEFRAQLNHIWLTQPPEVLRDISPIGTTVFASWVSENITHRFALDPREQLTLGIITAFYYQCLFTNETEFSEREKLRIANLVQRATRASIQDVLEILDRFEHPITDIDDYCKKVVEIVGSVRLNELNVGVLYSIVGRTWFGPNASETTAIALEHPPTWLAILMSAINERAFKNTRITKIAERGHGDHGAQFSRAILRLVELAAK